MRLLLDTHLLLWAASDKLPSKAIPYFENEENSLLYSPASIWEIVIKAALRRKDFIINVTEFQEALNSTGYEELPILSEHALFIEKLPTLHKDPFDRMLLAQAAFEGVPLLTADRQLVKYPGNVISVM